MKNLTFSLGKILMLLLLMFGFLASSFGSVIAEEQQDTTITLREPFFDDQKTIDVSESSLTILANWVSMVYRYVLALSAIIIVLVFMAAGFILMTSGGDSGARTTAKDLILKSLMGLAALFLAGLFLATINPNFYVFGGSSNLGTIENPTTTP